MRHIITVIAITGSLAACAAANGQSAVTLPDGLRAHVKDDSFQIVSSIRGLPLGVRDELGELINGAYTDFADPGTPFSSTGTDASLPVRRLVAAACSADHHCIVYYERGGTPSTWHVAVFQWAPMATFLEFGGAAPAGLSTLDAVRNAILSGAIKDNANSW